MAPPRKKSVTLNKGEAKKSDILDDEIKVVNSTENGEGVGTEAGPSVDVATGSAAISQAEVKVEPTEANPVIKFKYKEAAPCPPGMTNIQWNKTFNAADSRIYNKAGKSHTKSAAARATGETRVLALQIAEVKAKKIASSLSDASPVSEPHIEIDSSSNLLEVKQQVDIKMEPSSSRDATPASLWEQTSNIADKVKGKSRTTKRQSSSSSSRLVSTEPSTITSGRKDSFVQSTPHPAQQEPTPMPASDIVQQSLSSLSPTKQSSPQPFAFGGHASSEPVPFSFSQPVAGIANEFQPGSRGTLFTPGSTEQDAALTQVFGQMYVDSSDHIKEGTRKRSASAVGTPQPSAAPPPAAKPTQAAPKKRSYNRKKKPAAASIANTGTGKGRGKGKAAAQEVDDEDSESESSNDGGEYCICRGPDDHRLMVACDECDEWFHCSCVGVEEQDIELIDKYVCQKCKIPNVKYTTWKPMCRLAGCRKPCNLHLNPPSKYCTPEHKKLFFVNAIAKMPNTNVPSRGGALTKGELKAALESTKGRVAAFHTLGQKPTLSEGALPIDWNAVLNLEEKARLVQITVEIGTLEARCQGFKDKEKIVRMAIARQKKIADGNKEMTGISGWDERQAMNEEEFLEWRKGAVGNKAFETNTLPDSCCEKKRCQKHLAWVKLTMQDTRFENVEVQKTIAKFRGEEQSIQDRAKTRVASQM